MRDQQPEDHLDASAYTLDPLQQKLREIFDKYTKPLCLGNGYKADPKTIRSLDNILARLDPSLPQHLHIEYPTMSSFPQRTAHIQITSSLALRYLTDDETDNIVGGIEITTAAGHNRVALTEHELYLLLQTILSEFDFVDVEEEEKEEVEPDS